MTFGIQRESASGELAKEAETGVRMLIFLRKLR
jgi:hypothetical protein